MEGKSGKKILTSRPRERAVSSAQESGPLHPPEITIESLDKEDINFDIFSEDLNFLDPTTPTFIVNNTTITNPPKSRLFHHSRSFMGCFSCNLRKNIDYQSFMQWKNDSNPKITLIIASVITKYITNYYDFITTAPPSKNRDFNNYCCFNLCNAISAMTKISFIISFQQRKKKSRHGRYASLEGESPELVSGWDYKNKSILFIDDFITSGTTAKTCYEILRGYENHVDGLIYCQY